MPYEVKILCERQCYVPLEELALGFAEHDVEGVCKLYVQPTEHRWYWKDGVSFKPYGSSVNQKLEQAYVSKVPSVEVQIGSSVYEINIRSMAQTNIHTKNI